MSITSSAGITIVQPVTPVPVSVQLDNLWSQPPTVFPFGELNAESRSDSISLQFQYPSYNTEFDLKPAVGTGNATVANGLLNVIATTGQTEYVESKDAVRYRPGHGGYAQFTAKYVGTGVGYAGLWAVNKDGFIFKVDNGTLAIGYVKSGVEVLSYPVNDSFYGSDFLVSDIDLTKVNIWRILFGYLGVANPVYQIKIYGRWHTLGTIETEGLLDFTHIDNPVLPIGFKSSNGMTVSCASANAGKMGDSDNIGARSFSSTSSATLSGTTKNTIVTFRNKATFQGIENRVKAKLIRYEFFVDAPASGTGTVQFRIEKNAVLTGTPTWVDNDTLNSIIEADTVADYDSGGRTIFVEHAGYSSGTGNATKSAGGLTQDAESFNLFLQPNETATITAQNVSGNTNVVVRTVFNWIELF